MSLVKGMRLLMVEAMQGRLGHRLTWVVVSKVGRKWATLVSEDKGYACGRCEIDSLRYDSGGYSSNVTLYGSQDEYEEALEETALWREISDIVRGYNRPRHLALDDLRKLVGILRTPTPIKKATPDA